MTIAELSVRRPVTVTMVYILICVVACVFIPRLGIALYPTTELPVLSVMTTYSGVGPEEIDENVTQVIENAIKGVSGIKQIRSNSTEGRSNIMLEFGYDQDLDEAQDDIEQALNSVINRLPDDCGTPTVRQYDMSSMPIMRLAVQGELPRDELNNLAEDTITPMLERVNGVASVDVRGGSAKEIRVDIDRNRLDAYGLSFSAVSQALAARNIQLSSGEITQNGMDYEVVTSEYFENLDDIRQTVVTTIDGATIKVDDIADVYEGFDTTGRNVYINGIQSLYISVSNESDANPSSVSKGVQEILPKINEQLPRGITAYIISDDTTMIDSTMKEVYSSGISGALLAVVIIFLFLRNIKSSFIIGLSLPISILITLMCMSVMGLTCNLMTMAGLILGMGMVVDSSIVILENIYKHRAIGEKPAIAAILGSKNMINAIVASTLTTLCVFIPMLIYKNELEMIGQMFQEMVVTVVVSLISSLFVAVTIVPALCGSILKIETRTQKPLKNKILKKLDDMMSNGIKAVEDGYIKALEFCLNNRFLTITFVLAMLVYSIVQFSGMGMNLAPSSSADDQVNVTIKLPVGTNKEVVSEYLFRFQDIVIQECEGAYESIILDSGDSNSGSVQINLPEPSKQKMSPTDIKNALTPHLQSWSDVTITFSSGRGPGGSSSAIDVKLISNDTNAVEKTANEIIKVLEDKVPLVTDVTSDLENGSPRYRMVIDIDAASSAGVSVSTIANELKTAVSGTTATTYYENGDEIEVIVSLKDTDLQTVADLEALSINTDNVRMSLSNFISVTEGHSPQRIQREDGDRVNHVTAKLVEGAATTEVQSIVERVIDENIVLPESVELSYGGDAQDIENFGSAFVVIIILAIFLVFAVMAAQFESLVDPFIIFLSIPLLMIGVVGVYVMTGQTLSMYSIVGMVALVGIVVNNGIVLVDYTNQLVDKKIPVKKACLMAGKDRLQPILMTTLTTVIGMVPMAFFPGEGAESMQPVCITIVGGLCSGAFMTLFVTPVMYSLLNKRREKRFNDPMALINQLEELDSGKTNLSNTII